MSEQRTTTIHAMSYAGEHDPALVVTVEVTPEQERFLHNLAEQLPDPLKLGEVDLHGHVESVNVSGASSVPDEATEALWDEAHIGEALFDPLEDVHHRDHHAMAGERIILNDHGLGFRFSSKRYGGGYRSQAVGWDELAGTFSEEVQA